MRERLKFLVSYLIYKKLAPNQKAIGLVLGYTNESSISQLINGKVPLNDEFIKKLTSIAPEVDINWLKTGKGQILKSDERHPLEIYAPNLSKEELSKLTNYRPPSINDLVPYYGVDFTAGNAVATFDDQTAEPEYYMDVPDFRGCKAFRAYSDSMEPAIKSGSILFGTKLVDIRLAEFGQVYGVILNDGRRMLKYLRRHPADPSNLFMLSSENKVYDDMDIPKEAVKSLWLIHGHLSKRI